uniref:Uncharacterized protein n=1 Tax=Anguilla anguilla TaxID=7936 RepID=A0A0E9PRI3_ANGAN
MFGTLTLWHRSWSSTCTSTSPSTL